MKVAFWLGVHHARCRVVAAAAFLAISFTLPARGAGAGVTLTEDASAYTLSNGTVAARIDKSSGDLLSMKFKGTEMLATITGADGLPDTKTDKPGANLRGGRNNFTDHQYGFWSHDADGPNSSSKVTIDPKANGGSRAEVAIKRISDGKPVGAGPGGNFISDVEIRYAMGSGDAGLYTYSIFEHQPSYPASVLGEARFCTKLADFFDWMNVGPKWNKLYPKAEGAAAHEDKYDFTADQFENPVYGWSSTAKHVSFWFVNPSVEYLSGGPTKVEFLGHRDTNQVQAPTLLNYWRSSHYGGAAVDVDQGEHWVKVIGPFMLYVNEGSTPQAMYADAVARGKTEAAKWPYDWVNGVDYPRKQERATVSGRLTLKDAQAPSAKMSNIRVGLANPEYTVTEPGRNNGPAVTRELNWQTDAKHYEFWAVANADGSFKLTGVRPGSYTLYAFADGVFGELAKTSVTVAPGKPLDLGTVAWTPVRKGKQAWEIGIPNRTGQEFAGGDDYSHDGMFLNYAKLYPNDVTYTIGKSDFRKDWYYEQVPHNQDATYHPTGYNMGVPQGKATPWTVNFEMAKAPGSGKAHLRLGIAGSGTRSLDVAVNGKPVGTVDKIFVDGSIGRNGIHGVWSERDVTFDAAELKQGANSVTITVPQGSLISGVIWDYLRLEVE